MQGAGGEEVYRGRGVWEAGEHVGRLWKNRRQYQEPVLMPDPIPFPVSTGKFWASWVCPTDLGYSDPSSPIVAAVAISAERNFFPLATDLATASPKLLPTCSPRSLDDAISSTYVTKHYYAPKTGHQIRYRRLLYIPVSFFGFHFANQTS